MRGGQPVAALLLAATLVFGVGPAADGAAATRPVRPWSPSILDRDDAGRVAFIARPYAGSVIALDVADRRVRWETGVGGTPEALLFDGWDVPRLYVADPAGSTVVVLRAADGKLEGRLPVGSTPCGLSRSGDDHLVVSLRTAGEVVVWDLARGRIVARRAVGPHPCALAVDPEKGTLYVGHRFDPLVTILDEAGMGRRSELVAEGALNQTVALLLAPERRRLLVAHVLSYDRRDDPSYINALHPAVSVVDLQHRRFNPQERIEPALVDRPVNGPGPLARFRNGSALLMVHAHSNDVSAISLDTGLGLGNVAVGRHPRGVVVLPGQRRAWVANAHDHSLSILDLEALEELERVPYGREPLPEEVARGRDLFHDATSPRMVRNRWLVCANCHPQGGSDGRTWNLPGRGRLLTKDLRGAGWALPLGWRGDRDEGQDEELFIRGFLRGAGLSPGTPHAALGSSNAGLSADLDALAAYLDWLPPAANPPPSGPLAAAGAAAGRALFLSPSTGCADCHPPPLYTRALGGLAGLRRTGPQLDVPSLLGLPHRRRYFHDGRGETLHQVLTPWHAAGSHGRTAHLTARQVSALVTFLRSLQPPASPPG